MPTKLPTGSIANERGHAATSPAKASEAGSANAAKHKTGYLYAPAIGNDTVNSIMGYVANRLAGHKTPYAVVVRNEGDKLSLRKSITEYKTSSDCAKIVSMCDPKSVDTSKSRKSSSKFTNKYTIIEAARSALQYKLDIKVNDAEAVLPNLDEATTKLYILGHGKSGGGGDGIYIKTSEGKSERLSSQVLAERLKQDGLPMEYKDVRLIACHGKDKPSLDKPSTGQLVANAMGEAGFSKVQVTAYPEQHLVMPRIFGDGKLHRAVLCDGKNKPKIASAEKQIFHPQTQLPAANSEPQADTAKTEVSGQHQL